MPRSKPKRNGIPGDQSSVVPAKRKARAEKALQNVPRPNPKGYPVITEEEAAIEAAALRSKKRRHGQDTKTSTNDSEATANPALEATSDPVTDHGVMEGVVKEIKDEDKEESPQPKRRALRSAVKADRPLVDNSKIVKGLSKTMAPKKQSVAEVKSSSVDNSKLTKGKTGDTATEEPTIPQHVFEAPPDGEPRFWLMKAEPESRLEKGVDVKFSIDDLAAKSDPEAWDGVRNAMAQKNMRTMRPGELAFFYHSNCKVPGVAGIMQIVRSASVDESAFDPEHPYYDVKSQRAKPRWCVVHVRFVLKFDELVPLKSLQAHAKPGEPLENLQTLRLSRLSVSKVEKEEWDFVLGLGAVEEKSLTAALDKLGPV